MAEKKSVKENRHLGLRITLGVMTVLGDVLLSVIVFFGLAMWLLPSAMSISIGAVGVPFNIQLRSVQALDLGLVIGIGLFEACLCSVLQVFISKKIHGFFMWLNKLAYSRVTGCAGKER